jgi:hypothetical protein
MWFQILTITGWIMLASSIFFLHPALIPFEVAVRLWRLANIAMPIWHIALSFIKLSATLSILRVAVKRPWRVSLYVLMALQITFLVGNLVYMFISCIPLAANWDYRLRLRPETRCLGARTALISSTIGSGVNILTDVLLSLAPMFILWNLRRPRRERILVCALTGIGLLASASSLAKALAVQGWGKQDEYEVWSLAVSIATWWVLEMTLGVMAACSPALKRPLQRALGSVGFAVRSYTSRLSFIEVRNGRLGSGKAEEGGEQTAVELRGSSSDLPSDWEKESKNHGAASTSIRGAESRSNIEEICYA